MTILRLLQDRVAIKKDIKDRFSKGGIFLGESEENTGTVVAVGPGAYNNKNGKRKGMWNVKVGDKVFFSPHGNFRHVIDGEEIVIIRRDSLMGLVQQGKSHAKKTV